MFVVAGGAGLFFLSLVLTGLIRYHALSTQLLDIPNHRSSHTIPTPRGGGLSFVVCFLVALCILVKNAIILPSLGLALCGAGLLVAMLGFLDDQISLSARMRLAGHFVAVFFAVYFLKADWNLPWQGVIGIGFSVLYLVWLLNLYNFMDGIDGIAAVEALTVCLNMVFIYYSSGATDLVLIPLFLASAVAGFLIWNFPCARIFMGDVGSGFLGLMLGLLSLYSTTINSRFLWGWIIVLAVFITDASITLLRRAITRQPIFQAHRSHAYQQAARLFNGHLPVTLAVAFINVFWLLPIAMWVVQAKLNTVLGLMLAYLPLLSLALYLKAGAIEERKAEG